jgi:hypothetical protein
MSKVARPPEAKHMLHFTISGGHMLSALRYICDVRVIEYKEQKGK